MTASNPVPMLPPVMATPDDAWQAMLDMMLRVMTECADERELATRASD